MPDWDSEDIHDWKEVARREQQYYCDTLGERDYDVYESTEIKYLELKIGIGLFGSPTDVDENQNEVEVGNYDEHQREVIKNIKDQILNKTGSDNIHVAFIFLVIKEYDKRYQYPVMRLLDKSGNIFFVDHFARLYDGWIDFLKNNFLSKCIYCYPENGYYNIDNSYAVKVNFDTSPSCDIGERILEVADVTSIVSTIAALGMTAGGIMFPPAAPALLPAAAWVGAGTGAYAVGRNAYKLYDRGEHNQSVNPFTDTEARGCWFAVVGGALGIGAMGVLKYTTYLAQNGDIACKALRVTYSVLEGGSLSINGLGIVSQVYDLANKKEKVTVMDIVNLSTSVLFFTHACVSLKQASTIIKEVQNDVLNEYKSNLNEEHKGAFEKIVNATTAKREMYGNAIVIKSLKHIETPEKFFENLVFVQEEAGVENSVKFADNGLISINDQLVIHPDKMMAINQESRLKIMECTHKLQTDPEYSMQFKADVQKICSKERIRFEMDRKATVSKMSEALNVEDLADFKIGGKRIFADIQGFQIDRLGNVMEHSGQNYSLELLEIVKEFAKENNCKNISDFCSFVEFSNQFALDSRDAFNHLPKKQRLGAVLADLRNPDSGRMDEMKTMFNTLKQEVAPHNSTLSPGFASDNMATYHYYKHKDFDGTEFSAEDWFKMLKEHFKNGKLPKHSLLSQEANKVFITITDKNIGAKGVLIEPVVKSNAGNVFACTFMYDKASHDKYKK